MASLERLVEELGDRTWIWLFRRRRVLEAAAAMKALGAETEAFLAVGSKILPLGFPRPMHSLVIKGTGGPFGRFPFLLPGNVLPCESLAGFLVKHGCELRVRLNTLRWPLVFLKAPTSLFYVEAGGLWPALAAPFGLEKTWFPLAYGVLLRAENGHVDAVVSSADILRPDEDTGWGVNVHARPGSELPDLIAAWFLAVGAKDVFVIADSPKPLEECLSGWDMDWFDEDVMRKAVCVLWRTRKNVARAEKLAARGAKPIFFRPAPKDQAAAIAGSVPGGPVGQEPPGYVTVKLRKPPRTLRFPLVEASAEFTLTEDPWRAVRKMLELGETVAKVKPRTFVQVPPSSVFRDTMKGPFFPVLSPDVPDALLVEERLPVYVVVKTGRGPALLFSRAILVHKWRQGQVEFCVRVHAISGSNEAASEAIEIFMRECLGMGNPADANAGVMERT